MRFFEKTSFPVNHTIVANCLDDRHHRSMRPVVVACVVVAGTAVRLLFTKLNPLQPETQQQQQTGQNEDENNQTNQSRPTEQQQTEQRQRQLQRQSRRQHRRRQHQSSSSSLKIHRHPQVHALLNSTSPIITGAQYVKMYGTDRDCTCCLETITESSKSIRVTQCRHGFHADCLEQWLQYTAAPSMDWRNYIVSNDGSIDFQGPIPSCPNCTSKIPVLPPLLVRSALLTAIANALCLPDLTAAAHMFNAGVVYRASQNPWSNNNNNINNSNINNNNNNQRQQQITTPPPPVTQQQIGYENFNPMSTRRHHPRTSYFFTPASATGNSNVDTPFHQVSSAQTAGSSSNNNSSSFAHV